MDDVFEKPKVKEDELEKDEFEEAIEDLELDS